MRYKLLGRSGLRVSELCLGTMTFGEDWGWGASKDESRKIYDAFQAAGGNFIDTANLYTNGTSERFLGEFMEGHRDSIVLATKYANATPGKDPNAAGNHRKSMVHAWRERMGSDAGKHVYKERASTSETANAQMRRSGLLQLTVRGVGKATCVALWSALAYNLVLFATALRG